MRFDRLKVKVFVGLISLAGCITTAYAATALPPDLAGLPWMQIGVGAALSLWGGLVRTAERALDAIKANEHFRWWPELTKDIVVSGGVGFLTYSFGAWMNLGVWQLGGTLFVMGYLGTRGLSLISDRFMKLPPAAGA